MLSAQWLKKLVKSRWQRRELPLRRSFGSRGPSLVGSQFPRHPPVRPRCLIVALCIPGLCEPLRSSIPLRPQLHPPDLYAYRYAICPMHVHGALMCVVCQSLSKPARLSARVSQSSRLAAWASPTSRMGIGQLGIPGCRMGIPGRPNCMQALVRSRGDMQ